MNFKSAASKNLEVKKPVKVEIKKIKNNEKNRYDDLMFKDVDEEFDFAYCDKVTDISIEFRDFISKNYLPFMDKIINVQYTLHDFIKYNSNEYIKIQNQVTDYNNELIDDFEKEQEEKEKELMEEEYRSD